MIDNKKIIAHFRNAETNMLPCYDFDSDVANYIMEQMAFDDHQKYYLSEKQYLILGRQADSYKMVLRAVFPDGTITNSWRGTEDYMNSSHLYPTVSYKKHYKNTINTFVLIEER